MSDEATARPWHIDEFGDIRDGRHRLVRVSDHRALIVRAVNTHDAALSALREAQGFVCALGDNAHVLGVTVPQMLARIDALLAPDGQEKKEG